MSYLDLCFKIASTQLEGMEYDNICLPNNIGLTIMLTSLISILLYNEYKLAAMVISIILILYVPDFVDDIDYLHPMNTIPADTIKSRIRIKQALLALFFITTYHFIDTGKSYIDNLIIISAYVFINHIIYSLNTRAWIYI